MINGKTIGSNIKRIMNERGINTNEFAKKTEYATPTIAKYLCYGPRTIESLFTFADILDCDVSEFLKDSYEDHRVHTNKSYILNTYPYNLALDVMLFNNYQTITHEHMTNEEMLELVHEIYIPELIKAIDTLPLKQKTVIENRYKDGKTYEEIGKMYNRTREGIRIIITNAMEKLTEPSRFIKIKIHSAEEYKALNTKFLALEYLHNNMVEKLNEEYKEYYEFVENKKYIKISIEELGLSVRSRNCLLRSGIKTVGELLEQSDDDLMMVRNLGRKGIEEIKSKLAIFLSTKESSLAK